MQSFKKFISIAIWLNEKEGIYQLLHYRSITFVKTLNNTYIFTHTYMRRYSICADRCNYIFLPKNTYETSMVTFFEEITGDRSRGLKKRG